MVARDDGARTGRERAGGRGSAVSVTSRRFGGAPMYKNYEISPCEKCALFQGGDTSRLALVPVGTRLMWMVDRSQGHATLAVVALRDTYLLADAPTSRMSAVSEAVTDAPATRLFVAVADCRVKEVWRYETTSYWSRGSAPRCFDYRRADAGIAAASATPQSQVARIDLAGLPVAGPCWTEQLTIVKGDLTFVQVNSTDGSGNVHAAFQANYQGVQAVSNTGVRYVVVSGTHQAYVVNYDSTLYESNLVNRMR